MDNENPENEEENRELPPVNGMEYPTKPGKDATAMEMMEYLEQVDRYWQKRGFQRLHDDDEESVDEQE